MPATSAKAASPLLSWRWKTRFTDGCGTTCEVYGSGRSQSISQ